MTNPALLNWSEVAPSAIRASLAAYKYRHEIQRWWKKLLVYTGQGATNIAIVGRPTTGKSMLSSMLRGEAADLTWNIPGISTKTESSAIQLGEWTKIVSVVPGQTSRERDQSLFDAFHGNNLLEGVIYVADWGYTQVRDPVVAKEMISVKGISTIQALRSFNLEQELQDFTIIADRIREAHSHGYGPKWLLVAVNKVDLFYEEINDAQKYYHPEITSPFTKILTSMISQIGKQNITCVSLPVCAWGTDFRWNTETRQTNMGGNENQRALLRNMVEQIALLSSQT